MSFWLIFVILSALTYADLKKMVVYDVGVIVIAALGIANAVYEGELVNSLATGAIVLVFLTLFKIFYARGFGSGDIKLISALALYFRFPKILIFGLVTAICSAVLGSVYLLIKKKRFSTLLPQVPFLWLAFIVTRFVEFEL